MYKIFYGNKIPKIKANKYINLESVTFWKFMKNLIELNSIWSWQYIHRKYLYIHSKTMFRLYTLKHIIIYMWLVKVYTSKS